MENTAGPCVGLCGFFLFIMLSWFIFTRQGKEALRELSSDGLVSDIKLALAEAKVRLHTWASKNKGERKQGTVSNCDLCARLSKQLKEYTVYSANISGFSRKTEFKQYEVTTFYGEIRDHRFQVCPRCRILRAWLILLLVFFIIWIVLVFLFGEGQIYNADLWGAMLIFAVPAALFVIYKYVSLQRQLIRIAVAERKKESPESKFVGLTKLELEMKRSRKGRK